MEIKIKKISDVTNIFCNLVCQNATFFVKNIDKIENDKNYGSQFVTISRDIEKIGNALSYHFPIDSNERTAIDFQINSLADIKAIFNAIKKEIDGTSHKKDFCNSYYDRLFFTKIMLNINELADYIDTKN